MDLFNKNNILEFYNNSYDINTEENYMKNQFMSYYTN